MAAFPSVPGGAVPGSLTPADPGLIAPAVPAVAQSWSGSAVPSTLTELIPGAIAPPANHGVSVPVAMPAGDWAVAIVAWRQPSGAPAADLASVADDAHSWWEPLGAPLATSDAQGVTRITAWFCPRSRASTVVQASPTGFVTALAMIVLDVTGMSDWIGQVQPVLAFANQASALSMSSQAPPSSAFMVAAAASDLLTAGGASEVTGPGAGWTGVPVLTAANLTDHTGDIALNVAWQVTAAGTAANWAASPDLQDFSGVICGLLASPPPLAQPNPNWPVVVSEAAPGGGQYTLAGQLSWVPLAAPVTALAFTQGRQYELDRLAAGSGSLTLDNPQGLIMPPAFAGSAGIDSGTPVRQRWYWPGGAWQQSWQPDGVTAGPGISQNFGGGGFAAPGVTYAKAAWLGSSAAYAPGQQLLLNFYDGSLRLLATFASAPVTGPASRLALVQGTAPPGTVIGNVQATAPGVPPGSTVFYASAGPAQPGPLVTGVPLPGSWAPFGGASASALAAWAPDNRGAPNPTPWYVPFSGFIERMPQQWGDLPRNVTDAAIVDSFASLIENMQPILPAEILEDMKSGPGWYWPCTDLPGSSAAANLAPGNNNPLFVTQSKYGATLGTQAFGSNGGAIAGAQGTFLVSPQFRISSEGGMWGQAYAAVPPNDNFQGWSLVAADAKFPAPAGGITTELWFQVTTPFNIQANVPRSVILSVQSPGPARVGWSLVITATDGFLKMNTSGTNAKTGPYTTVSAVNYLTGTPPLVYVAVTWTDTTWTAYVNGTFAATGTWAKPVTSWAYLSLNGLAGTPLLGSLFGDDDTIFELSSWSGSVGQVAVYPRVLSQLRIWTHFQAGSAGMSGEPAGHRIERLLLAGTDAVLRRMIMYDDAPGAPFADDVASCADIAGNPVGSAVGNIAASVPPGTLIVTPGNEIFLLAKHAAFGQPSRWILGEAEAAGEVPYQPDAVIAYDPARVFNNVQLTQLDTGDAVTSGVPAITQASTQQYGAVTLNATGYLKADSTSKLNAGPSLLDLANWIATTNRAPVLRGEVITVSAAAQPSAWPVVLGAACGDMVTLNARPPGFPSAPGAPAISIPGRISQTRRALASNLEATTGNIELIIDSAPEQAVLTCDDPVLGQLNGKNLLAWLRGGGEACRCPTRPRCTSRPRRRTPWASRSRHRCCAPTCPARCRSWRTRRSSSGRTPSAPCPRAWLTTPTRSSRWTPTSPTRTTGTPPRRSSTPPTSSRSPGTTCARARCR